MELSKSDKKKARILMDKGILKEFEICNASVLAILTDWKSNKKETRETYGKVYEIVKKNDNTWLQIMMESQEFTISILF